uniref:Uncharacterized protein n=1 Tax=viral metagenome TaxID=1070528 RepID=A0A6C0H1D8_9ZZZZ
MFQQKEMTTEIYIKFRRFLDTKINDIQKYYFIMTTDQDNPKLLFYISIIDRDSLSKKITINFDIDGSVYEINNQISDNIIKDIKEYFHDNLVDKIIKEIKIVI